MIRLITIAVLAAAVYYLYEQNKKLKAQVSSLSKGKDMFPSGNQGNVTVSTDPAPVSDTELANKITNSIAGTNSGTTAQQKTNLLSNVYTSLSNLTPSEKNAASQAADYIKQNPPAASLSSAQNYATAFNQIAGNNGLPDMSSVMNKLGLGSFGDSIFGNSNSVNPIKVAQQ